MNNPGPVEEGAKVATSVIDALRKEPLSLALVVMNVILLAFFFYITYQAVNTREREVKMIYENQRHMAEMLTKCVDPDALKNILEQLKKQ